MLLPHASSDVFGPVPRSLSLVSSRPLEFPAFLLFPNICSVKSLLQRSDSLTGVAIYLLALEPSGHDELRVMVNAALSFSR